MSVEPDELATVVGALALGTLDAIAHGVLPVEAAVWSLGAPRMWRPLQGRSPKLDQIVEVLRACDELSGIEEAAPGELPAEIARLAEALRAILRGQATWSPTWTPTPAAT